DQAARRPSTSPFARRSISWSRASLSLVCGRFIWKTASVAQVPTRPARPDLFSRPRSLTPRGAGVSSRYSCLIVPGIPGGLLGNLSLVERRARYGPDSGFAVRTCLLRDFPGHISLLHLVCLDDGPAPPRRAVGPRLAHQHRPALAVCRAAQRNGAAGIQARLDQN